MKIIKKEGLLALTLALASTQLWADASEPFKVIKKSDEADRSGDLIYETSDYEIRNMGGPTAQKAFERLFALNLVESDVEQELLEDFGEVLFFAKNDMALIRLTPRMVNALSTFFDGMGGQTRLMKLYGDPIVKPSRVVSFAPVLSPTSKIPAVANLIEKIDMTQITETVKWFEAMKTRHHESTAGKQVTQKVIEKAGPWVAGRTDITMEPFKHDGRTGQDSFVIRIKGQSKPDEIIILGAHIDSTSSMSSTLAPGADDNASGVAATLEVLRVIGEQKLHFQRTIEIHGYAAEEIGLVGSQHIADTYKSQGKNVIAMLQNDMNLYRSSSVDRVYFLENGTDSALTADIGGMAKLYLNYDFQKVTFTKGTSDHASWNRKGFAATLVTEDPNDYNPKIHSTADTVQNGNKGDFTYATAFARLNLAYAAIYAGLVEPATDEPGDAPSPTTPPEGDHDTPAPVQEGACHCTVDEGATRCMLIRVATSEIVSWTALVKDHLCDETFCANYFRLGFKNQCGASTQSAKIK